MAKNDTHAYWITGSQYYTEPRSQKDIQEQKNLFEKAQAVGEWEKKKRISDRQKLTWFYSDFGSFVPKHYVTPEQLTEKYNEIMLMQKEKTHTFNFEKSAEQNYNMIDGVVNNRAVPEADLTDGQTHEEMRELAPETLPENNRSEPNEAELNFTAWLTVTESSRFRWVEDEIVRLNGRGAMYYTGGEDGIYMRIHNDGKLEAGDYEGAIPHIGEAFFKPAVTKQFDTYSEAYTRAMEAGGKQFLVDMFSGGERQPLHETMRGAADEKPSVMDEIKSAQKAQREQPQTPKPGRVRKKSDPEL